VSVNAKHGTKFAWRLLAAAGILNVNGRLLLLAAPLHTLNVYPVLAVASTVIDSLAEKLPAVQPDEPGGLTATEPPLEGTEERDSRKQRPDGAKYARSTKGAAGIVKDHTVAPLSAL
jgi:hypothetical protein